MDVKANTSEWSDEVSVGKMKELRHDTWIDTNDVEWIDSIIKVDRDEKTNRYIKLMKLDLIEHEVLDDNGGMSTFMDIDGITLCRIYWYNDRKSLFMDNLDVSEDHRGKGYGTYLQEYREERARQMGYKQTMLWVKRSSWMAEWYVRRGYVYHSEYEDKSEDAVWMKKVL